NDGCLGQDVGHSRVVFAGYRPSKRSRASPSPGIKLCEGGPVGGKEMRFGLRTEYRLAEVVSVLLVGSDWAVALAEDGYPLGAEANVEGGCVHEQRAQPVSHDSNSGVARRRQRHYGWKVTPPTWQL